MLDRVQPLVRNIIWDNGLSDPKSQRSCFEDFWIPAVPVLLHYDPKAFERGEHQRLEVVPVEVKRGEGTLTITLIIGNYFHCPRYNNSPRSLGQAIERFTEGINNPHILLDSYHFEVEFQLALQGIPGYVTAWWSLDENFVCAWTIDRDSAGILIRSLRLRGNNREPMRRLYRRWSQFFRRPARFLTRP